MSAPGSPDQFLEPATITTSIEVATLNAGKAACTARAAVDEPSQAIMTFSEVIGLFQADGTIRTGTPDSNSKVSMMAARIGSPCSGSSCPMTIRSESCACRTMAGVPPE